MRECQKTSEQFQENSIHKRIHSVNPKKEKTIYHMKKKFSKERDRKKYQVILDLKYSIREKKNTVRVKQLM